MDGEVDAFETIAMLPLAAPGVSGVKVVEKVKLCPAVRVRGVLKPLMPNPVPLKVTFEMMTLEPPELIKAAVCVPVLPTCTVPKLTGPALRDPGATPTPDRGMVSVDAGLLVVIARFTLLLPAAWGENTTLNEVLAPAARVSGRLRPRTVYPAPVADWVRVMLEPPELAKVSGKLWLLPFCTLPKLRLGALGVSPPAVSAVPETGAVSVGFEALLAIARLKLSIPAACGANITLKAVL
jgi:hypothetical protein